MSDKHVWMNGQLVPADRASVSVFDHGLLYGDGVFEGIRAYRGRVFKLRTHLKRLYDGAARIELKIPYELDALDAAVRETLAANKVTDGYVRLCITRGVGYLGLNPYLCDHPTTFIIADAIKLYPAEMYEHGMPIITSSVRRNDRRAMDPAIKSMNYLNNIRAKIEAVKAGVPEALMLSPNDNVAECTGDNIFIVKDRGVITPPLTEPILPGVTRAVVLDLARQHGIKTREQSFTIHELYAADECFLTGTAAEVIPVTRVDDRPIGNDEPGPVTRKLIDAFHTLVAHAPED